MSWDSFIWFALPSVLLWIVASLLVYKTKYELVSNILFLLGISVFLLFFFREQSIRTLDELMEKVADKMAAINAIEVHAEINDYSVDDVEEMFYEYSVEELADEFCLQIESDED